MSKSLKIWNGGGIGVAPFRVYRDKGIRDASAIKVFACADSRAELLRMILAFHGGERLMIGMESTIKGTWVEGLWGTPMDGITPEPGIWIQYQPHLKPVRVWPRNCRTCGHFLAGTAARSGYVSQGRCGYDFTLPILPSCVRASRDPALFEKAGVWPEDGENCPAWSENAKAHHE